MAASIVSSIIFFLLFIILSLFVDVSVFAAQMEHRKLGGVKETMTMRRNLEENGGSKEKIGVGGSHSKQSGQKIPEITPPKPILSPKAQDPVKTNPEHQSSKIAYDALSRGHNGTLKRSSYTGGCATQYRCIRD